MTTQNDTFKPDYIVSPGQILEETLECRGIKKREFAERCGRTAKMVSEIIAGKAIITPETALQFERVLNVPASLWSSLESNYRLMLAEIEEKEKLEKHTDILKDFPFFNELVKNKFITSTNNSKDKIDKLSKLISFFGVGSIEALDNHLDIATSYRKSEAFKSNKYAVNAWLRCGEIRSLKINTHPYNSDKFKEALYKIRALTKEPIEISIPLAQELCAKAGVALVLLPEINKCHISGAARWLTKDKALIQLSARGMSDDHLWFTFFHEAGHILLHGKKDIFIDEEHYTNDIKENEADTFSQDMLIPKDAWETFINKIQWNTKEGIKDFSNEIGISSGIIVGRLQRPESDALKRFDHNDLKKRFQWDELSLITKTTN